MKPKPIEFTIPSSVLLEVRWEKLANMANVTTATMMETLSLNFQLIILQSFISLNRKKGC
jgi:hypothetical protein